MRFYNFSFKTLPSPNILQTSIQTEEITIDTTPLKNCNFNKMDIVLSFQDRFDPLNHGERNFKEGLIFSQLGTEVLTIDEIKKRMIDSRIINNCGSYSLDVTIRLNQNDESKFDLMVVQNLTLKSDANLNLRLTEEEVCSRGARGLRSFYESTNEESFTENPIPLYEIDESDDYVDYPVESTTEYDSDMKLDEIEKSLFGHESESVTENFNQNSEPLHQDPNQKLIVANEEEANSNSTNQIAMFATGGFILILIAIAIVIVILRKRKSRKTPSTEIDNNTLVYAGRQSVSAMSRK